MERIGKYQVRRVLGQGSMGTVHEAVDPSNGIRVAVKTMLGDLAEEPELRARFLREAETARGLRHPNVVAAFEAGEDGGQPYIVMEFVEGTDLASIIRAKQPISVEWKLDLIRQICEGLAYAHGRGVIHRDIKPANIRVTPSGEVKIMDFGIAHVQSSGLTRRGRMLGTVHYMAPEQVRGSNVDQRADIFAVGAIAYELFSGKRPFEGESLSGVMAQIAHGRADPSALPQTAYSPGLEATIIKALAPEAADRYSSLDEMRDDLGGLVREKAKSLDRSGASSPSETTDRTQPSTSIAEEPKAPPPVAPRREEGGKAAADVLVASAQEHLVGGRLFEALDAAEEALTASSGHGPALEIRGRVSQALERPEQAVQPEAEGLMSRALAAFVGSDYGRARAAAKKALVSDPGNKKAAELLKILDTLR